MSVMFVKLVYVRKLNTEFLLKHLLTTSAYRMACVPQEVNALGLHLNKN